MKFSLTTFSMMILETFMRVLFMLSVANKPIVLSVVMLNVVAPIAILSNGTARFKNCKQLFGY
jgi:hypothetical protein